ncbi:MAG: Ubiquinone biosynthesis O-methyltransferase [candidate division WS2 bacterium]|nr:Ubiquinone biosynthesis O-methyltransferase [Candidatus Psychracetigena formicireducens]
MTWYSDLTLRILHGIARITYILPRFSFEGRVIEYHFVHSNIEPDVRVKILDVGCGATNIPTELVNIGHEVYGIDIMPYHKPPKFTFVQANLECLPFDNDFFDIVTAISTIEHVGLGRYGDPISPDGDKKAMEEIKRVVKPGGKIIITIPCEVDTICYSKDGVPLHRVYSPISLNNLLSRLKILEISYIIKRRRIWFPASVSEVENVSLNAKSEDVGLMSVALIVAQKEKR